MRARPLPVLLIFCLVSSGASVAVALTPPSSFPSDRIDAAVAAAAQRLGIPGLSAAIVKEKQLRWSKGLGMADLENQVPARPTTVYRLASVSKPMTAAAVLQLVERGALDLDAPVRRYVPEFPEKPWAITLRHLLCHQGGIRNWSDAELQSTRRYTSLAESVGIFKEDPLLFEPGTKALYSTFGYTLLGRAVEGASGLSFLDYLRENVFRRAGMDAARADDVLAIIPNRAQGYQRTSNGTLANSPLSDTSNRIPGGGLCASAEDVGRFAAALAGGVLLKRETLPLMFTPQKLRGGAATGWGLGFVVGSVHGEREAYHVGGQARVSTLLYLRPDKGIAVVLLANLEGSASPLLDLARQLADLLTES